MNKEHMLSEVLCLPPTAIEYHLGQQLAKTFHDKMLMANSLSEHKLSIFFSSRRA